MQERMGDSNIACAPTGIDSFEIVGVTKLETLVSVALPLLIMGAQRQTITIRNAREFKRMKARGGLM
jgi:hypothetical protein